MKKYKQDRELPQAIIVIDLHGQSGKMGDQMAICESYGVPVIEDGAESLSSSYKSIGYEYFLSLVFNHLMATKLS